MAGAGTNKRDADGAKDKGVDDKLSSESLAARRRRIEMMRERQELMALLDDFGDGDIDLALLEDDDEEVGRWVSADGSVGSDSDAEIDGLDDEDDYYEDDFEDED